jgi:hypothetical protein
VVAVLYGRNQSDFADGSQRTQAKRTEGTPYQVAYFLPAIKTFQIHKADARARNQGQQQSIASEIPGLTSKEQLDHHGHRCRVLNGA